MKTLALSLLAAISTLPTSAEACTQHGLAFYGPNDEILISRLYDGAKEATVSTSTGVQCSIAVHEQAEMTCKVGGTVIDHRIGPVLPANRCVGNNEYFVKWPGQTLEAGLRLTQAIWQDDARIRKEILNKYHLDK